MSTNADNLLAAPCGICCAECIVYKSKDDQKVQEALIARGMRRESVPCPGCRAIRGKCPVISGTCETYECTGRQGLDFCFQCPDFPCTKLNPAADRADVLPHNLKIFNLCYIKEKGLGRWLEDAAEIQTRYYKGKMVVGKGPLI